MDGFHFWIDVAAGVATGVLLTMVEPIRKKTRLLLKNARRLHLGQALPRHTLHDARQRRQIRQLAYCLRKTREEFKEFRLQLAGCDKDLAKSLLDFVGCAAQFPFFRLDEVAEVLQFSANACCVLSAIAESQDFIRRRERDPNSFFVTPAGLLLLRAYRRPCP